MRDPVRLIHAYARLMDDRDFAGVAALFADGARIDYGPLGGEIGQHQLADFLAERVGRNTTRTSHHVSNIDVDIADDGASATASTYLYAWHWVPSIEHYEVWGRYDDELVKQSDVGWRFAARRLHVAAERPQRRLTTP
jgi:3-phenylpropionate/cinnamic acid dioxygenase small subunit